MLLYGRTYDMIHDMDKSNENLPKNQYPAVRIDPEQYELLTTIKDQTRKPIYWQVHEAIGRYIADTGKAAFKFMDENFDFEG